MGNSGYMVNWWIPAALQKEIIETTKIDECRDRWIGILIWHFVHHTPVHLFGRGPCCGIRGPPASTRGTSLPLKSSRFGELAPAPLATGQQASAWEHSSRGDIGQGNVPRIPCVFEYALTISDGRALLLCSSSLSS